MTREYTWDDLGELAPQWRETFGESMPYGFEVTPSIYEIMVECIRTKSQKPLDDYVMSLPKDEQY